MNDEKRETIKELENCFEEAKRRLEDLERIVEKDKEITEFYEFLCDLESRIQKEKQRNAGNKSLFSLENKLNLFLGNKALCFYETEIGKKYSDTESKKCISLQETREPSLDNVVAEVVAPGIKNAVDGTILVEPSLIVYHYIPVTETAEKRNVIKNYLSLFGKPTILFLIGLTSAMFAGFSYLCDYMGLLFGDGKNIILLGTSVSFLYGVLLFFLSEYLGKIRYPKLLFSDVILMTAVVSLVFLLPDFILNYALYKILIFVILLLTWFALTTIRIHFSGKNAHKRMTFFLYLENLDQRIKKKVYPFVVFLSFNALCCYFYQKGNLAIQLSLSIILDALILTVSISIFILRRKKKIPCDIFLYSSFALIGSLLPALCHNWILFGCYIVLFVIGLVNEIVEGK